MQHVDNLKKTARNRAEGGGILKQFITSVVVVMAFFSAMCPSWAQDMDNGVNSAVREYADTGSLPGTRVPRERIAVPVATPVDVPAEASPAPSRLDVRHSGKVQLELTGPAPATRTIVKYRNRNIGHIYHRSPRVRVTPIVPAAKKPQPAIPPAAPAKGGGIMPQDISTLTLLVIAIVAILALCLLAYRLSQGQQGNQTAETTSQKPSHKVDPTQEAVKDLKGPGDTGFIENVSIGADGSCHRTTAIARDVAIARELANAKKVEQVFAAFGYQSTSAPQVPPHTHGSTIEPVYVGAPKTVIPERMPEKVKKPKTVAEPAEPAADTAKPVEPATVTTTTPPVKTVTKSPVKTTTKPPVKTATTTV